MKSAEKGSSRSTITRLEAGKFANEFRSLETLLLEECSVPLGEKATRNLKTHEVSFAPPGEHLEEDRIGQNSLRLQRSL